MRAYWPGITITGDKFHLINRLQDIMDDARKSAAYRLKEEDLEAVRIWLNKCAEEIADLEGPSPASTRQPLVGAVLREIRRTRGVKPGPHRKDPLLTEQIRQLVSACGNDLRGIRDRALILFGFASGGMRRANLVAVIAESLEFCDAGIIYHLGRSKADQEGVGRLIGITWGSVPETCPVLAMLRLLDATRITSGPLFRAITSRGILSNIPLNPASACYIIKRRARLAGPNDQVYGAHSLRSGFCSQASLKMSDRQIMKQSGHKSPKSLDPYGRLNRLFSENQADSLGL